MQQAHHSRFVLKRAGLDDGTAEHFDQAAAYRIYYGTDEYPGIPVRHDIRQERQQYKPCPRRHFGYDDASSVPQLIRQLYAQKIHYQLGNKKYSRYHCQSLKGYAVIPVKAQK